MQIISAKFIVLKENSIKTEQIAFKNVITGLIDSIKSNKIKTLINKEQSFSAVIQSLLNKEWNMKKHVQKLKWKLKTTSVCLITCLTKKSNNAHQRKNDLMLYYILSYSLHFATESHQIKFHKSINQSYSEYSSSVPSKSDSSSCYSSESKVIFLFFAFL